MIDERFYSDSIKCEVMRISKARAKSMFKSGVEVFIIASKMMFDNPWTGPCRIKNDGKSTFEQICNDFKYYNCDYQRGYYINFYIRTK